MNHYTITKNNTGTTIKIPNKAKYWNKLNNTSYYTSRKEQCVKTHLHSWKKISTVYLDTITLNTENITDDTQFTFNFRNDNTDKTISIPVSEGVSQFAPSIIPELTLKYFYLVDLDNTDKFNTHILDFINTVFIDITSNSEVINELIEETPTPEEPEEQEPQEETPNTVHGLQQERHGNLTLPDGKQAIPVLLTKTTNNHQHIYYSVIFTDNQKQVMPVQSDDEYTEFLQSLILQGEYNGELVNPHIELTDAPGVAVIIIPLPEAVETTGTLRILLTDNEESMNTLEIIEKGE